MIFQTKTPYVPCVHHVAELTAVRGLAGVRTADLHEGTYHAIGARLRAGQEVVIPPGTLAELRLNNGTLLRLNEDTRLTLAHGRTLELISGELVALVADEQPPLRVRSGADTLDLIRGEVRVWSRGGRRSHDMVHGTASLTSDGRQVDLGPGAHFETPLASDTLPFTPEIGLRPLAATSWSRVFEATRPGLDAVPAGVGSLGARRAGSSTTLHRLALTEQKVHVSISGRIARTEVEQTFYNEAAEVLEGTYRFPLPADASISGLSLLVGETWMDAEMLEKRRARSIFRKVVDDSIVVTPVADTKIVEATIYRDGPGAHWDKNPMVYTIEKSAVNAKTVLTVPVAEGGGYAVSLVPIVGKDLNSLPKYKAPGVRKSGKFGS